MKEISKILKPVAIVFLLSLLTACLTDEDPPTEVEVDNGINIDGDWKTSCKNNSEDGTSTIDSFKFSEDSFTYQEHLYSDNSCNQFIESKTRTGKITRHGEESKITPSKKEAYEKDLLFDDGEEWKSLVALEDDEDKNTTFYLASGFDGADRPDDIIIGKDVFTLKKGTVPPPQKHVDIDGNWKTGCLNIQDEDTGVILSFEFSGNRFTYRGHLYSDSSCKQFKETESFPGKISYGKELKTPSGRTAHEIDFLFDNGVEWKSLVAIEDDDNMLYMAINGDGKARPDDITSDNSRKFSKGTVPPPPKHVDIDGTWKMDCIYLEDDKIGAIWTLKFSGERFSLQTSIYSDNSCTQSKGSVLDGGKVIYGKEITTPSGLTAHEIDLQFTKEGGAQTGSTWESLVARKGNTLLLSPDVEKKGRPVDFSEGGTIPFTKQ